MYWGQDWSEGYTKGRITLYNTLVTFYLKKHLLSVLRDRKEKVVKLSKQNFRISTEQTKPVNLLQF